MTKTLCSCLYVLHIQEEQAALKKKRTFRKYSYRGVDLDQLLDLSNEQLMELVHCRARRRFSRGMKRKPLQLMKRLRKAKKEAGPMEKPECIKTHLRDMIIVPEMIGSVIGVYNGKVFNQVEIKVRVATFQSSFILPCSHKAAYCNVMHEVEFQGEVALRFAE